MKIQAYISPSLVCLAVLFSASCSPAPQPAPSPTKKATPPPAVPPQNVTGKTPAPQPLIPPAPPAPEPAPSIPEPGDFPPDGFTGIPDWKSRFQDMVTWLRPKFTPPKIGQKVTLQLNTGGEASGAIKALDDASVILQVALAEGEMEVTYSRGQLAPRTRSSLFTEDACRTRAADIVRREKNQWEEQQRMLVSQASPPEQIPTGTPQTAPPAAVAVVPVNDPSRGGAVNEVLTWMKSNLRNANTIRVLKWYPVERNSKGYQVRCKYNIQMDGFGQAEERRIFFINHQGRVYRTAGYKEE